MARAMRAGALNLPALADAIQARGFHTEVKCKTRDVGDAIVEQTPTIKQTDVRRPADSTVYDRESPKNKKLLEDLRLLPEQCPNLTGKQLDTLIRWVLANAEFF